MSAPPPAVHLTATSPLNGCTGCHSQRTVILHPDRGRLCADCVTLPDGPFRPDLAANMVELGRVDAAFAYLRAFLTAEIRRRFDAAAVTL